MDERVAGDGKRGAAVGCTPSRRRDCAESAPGAPHVGISAICSLLPARPRPNSTSSGSAATLGNAVPPAPDMVERSDLRPSSALHPRVAAWFRGRGWTPYEFQEQTWR